MAAHRRLVDVSSGSFEAVPMTHVLAGPPAVAARRGAGAPRSAVDKAFNRPEQQHDRAVHGDKWLHYAGAMNCRPGQAGSTRISNATATPTTKKHERRHDGHHAHHNSGRSNSGTPGTGYCGTA